MPTSPEPAVLNTPLAGVPEREPQLFRFGLRHLFFYLSIATILFASLARLGGPWPMVVGSVASLFAAHVFGTFLGTRLRDTSHEVQRWKGRPESIDRDEPVALPQPVHPTDFPQADVRALAGYDPIGQAPLWPMVVGVVTGAVCGTTTLAIALGRDVTWPGLALGSVSCGVIGAWVALLATNFWYISRHALREATKDLPRRKPTSRRK